MKKAFKLWEVTEDLCDVAMGRKPADLVIKNGKLVNVNTKEILPNTDVAIVKGRIALVGDASHCIGDNTEVIDATDLYISPGFMDGHIHVESSMMSVREYAKTVMPHGTTSIYMDPHEIANVLGMKGVDLMIEDGKVVPLRVFTTMPSCVPATPFFEDNGAFLGPKEVDVAMSLKKIVGLGEMMNFPGVINSDPDVHKILKSTLKANKTITGHYSMPETGKGLNAYIASGARCCHETVRCEDALAKARLGMYVQVREGSAWHDLKETIKAVTEHNIDSRFITLVSDDTHPDTLIEDGHMDHIVRRAIEEGVNPITAIQMVTLNVAECFNMSRDLGTVSPGKCADIVLLSDLTKVSVEEVLINGEVVAKNGETTLSIPEGSYEDVKNTMHIKANLKAEDFNIQCPTKNINKAKLRVMEIIEAKVGTYHREIELPIKDDLAQIDLENDVIKVAVIERHKKTGTMGKGFVKGLRVKEGAIASTVAHDAHNLLVVGTNDEDMAFAANKLAEVGGGMIAVRNGEVLAMLPLPIAGLMSDEPVEEIAKKLKGIEKAWETLGCDLISPFMTTALISLAVIPELRLTNKGLVDTVKFEFVDLFI